MSVALKATGASSVKFFKFSVKDAKGNVSPLSAGFTVRSNDESIVAVETLPNGVVKVTAVGPIGSATLDVNVTTAAGSVGLQLAVTVDVGDPVEVIAEEVAEPTA